MATQPRNHRDHVLAKNERNRALIDDYLGGLSRNQTAAKYGIHRGRLNFILRQHQILLPPEERSRRMHERDEQQPRGGRPAIWPDCPPHLVDEYDRLRRKGLRAGQARSLLDPEFRHDAR